MNEQKTDFLLENIFYGMSTLELMPENLGESAQDKDEKLKMAVQRAKEEKIDIETAQKKNTIERIVGQFIGFAFAMSSLLTCLTMIKAQDSASNVMVTLLLGFTPLIGSKIWIRLKKRREVKSSCKTPQ